MAFEIGADDEGLGKLIFLGRLLKHALLSESQLTTVSANKDGERFMRKRSFRRIG
jgi:hypothetical protein